MQLLDATGPLQGSYEDIFTKASNLQSDHLKWQLSYDRMLMLSETMLDWASQPGMQDRYSIKLFGWAKGLRTMASDVGEHWDPPEPDNVSLLGFLGRLCEREYERVAETEH